MPRSGSSSVRRNVTYNTGGDYKQWVVSGFLAISWLWTLVTKGILESINIYKVLILPIFLTLLEHSYIQLEFAVFLHFFFFSELFLTKNITMQHFF